MPATAMSAGTAARLRMALGDPAVVGRYWDKVVAVAPYACLFWTGAVAAKGHGRFWIADDTATRDYVVIAHRFGYGLTHGFDALTDVEVVAHQCDNTLCQLLAGVHRVADMGRAERRSVRPRRGWSGRPVRGTGAWHGWRDEWRRGGRARLTISSRAGVHTAARS